MEQLNKVIKISDEQLENVVGGKFFEWKAKSTEQKITYCAVGCLGLIPLGGFIYKVGKLIYNKIK